MRVLVVEDGDIGRLGRTAALGAQGHEVTARRWSQVAGDRAGGLGEFEVVLAVLAPDRSSWDRYPMIRSLGALVAGQAPAVSTIAMLEGQAADNPLIALRLNRAGVHRLVDTAVIRTVDDMHRLITDPAATRSSRPRDVDLLAVGVSPGTDPDALVAWVGDRLAGPLADEYRNAFDPRYTQNACGLTRRQALTLRARLAGLGRIRPNLCNNGGGPVRDRSLPRWNEVVSVVNLARGLERDDVVPGDGSGGRAGSWRAA